MVHEGSTVEIPASDGRCAENQARSSSTTESRFRRKMAPAVRTYCLFVRAPPAIMPYSSVTVPCKITLNPGRDTREQATKRTHERRHESTHERRHTHQRKRPTVYMHGLGPSMWGCEWSHWTNRTTRSRSSRSGGVRTACSLQLYCTLLPTMPAPRAPRPRPRPRPRAAAAAAPLRGYKKPQSFVAAQLNISWHIQRNYVRQHGRCYKRYNITSPIPHPSRMPLCRISGSGHMSGQRGSAHGTQHGHKPSHGYSDHRRGSVIFTRSSDFVRA